MKNRIMSISKTQFKQIKSTINLIFHLNHLCQKI